MRRLFSAVVSAALLISLCACDLNDPLVDDPFARESASARPSRTPDSSDPPDSSEAPPDESATFPEPTPTPGPEYDKGHRLDATIPALIDGLELPVSGSTGYTSVKLPLWSSIPGEDEDPEPTDSSEPEPDPPAESADPAPDDPVEPDASTDPAESTPLSEGTQEPAQTEAPPFVTLPSSEAPGPTETPAPTPEPEPADTPDPYENAVAVWAPGTAFLILGEEGDWWYVSRGEDSGWIEHRYCMINLPDVIPSIIYYDANANASLFTAVKGKEIPGITGVKLYESMTANDRLDKQEFVMPILYSAARNICAAQHKALAEGNCLVVYQTFRPYEAQIAVARAMSSLASTDPEVKAGISTPPWSIDWFIATGVSNHQRGYALDASMVKVYATETKYVGAYPYLRVTDYEDYRMPTPMHELSYAAAATTGPNNYSQRSPTMNEPAVALQKYFTSSGLSLLPSEWWHFNDNAAMRATADKPSDGRYFTSECLSCLPG